MISHDEAMFFDGRLYHVLNTLQGLASLLERAGDAEPAARMREAELHVEEVRAWLRDQHSP